jgi:catechol 2,3-dioxygenase-like lactoylglutathione lyase family enzyme
MLGHLGINVPDLAAAKSYYDELMPLLGYETFETTEECAYMPAEGKRGAYLFLYQALEPGEYSRHREGLQHLAFMVPTRSAVRSVHRWVTEKGGEVLHRPTEFPQYPQPYFATFWLDPFGIMLEAVCHHVS